MGEPTLLSSKILCLGIIFFPTAFLSTDEISIFKFHPLCFIWSCQHVKLPYKMTEIDKTTEQNIEKQCRSCCIVSTNSQST